MGPVLLCYDGSDHADRAARLAGTLLRPRQAVVLHVPQKPFKYRRFLSPMGELGEKTVRHLTEIDHHDHEAIIALDQRDGDGIGVARYVRDPMRPDTGEVAVTVVDEWQGRGLGTLLLDVLSVRARQEGIRTFTALMLARNEQMMDLFQQLGPVRIVGRGAGTVEIEVAIPDPRSLSDHRP
jgi:GNAT superfamily N-acetyltransferase